MIKLIKENFNSDGGYITAFDVNIGKITREVNDAIQEAVQYIDSGDSYPTWHWELGHDDEKMWCLVLGFMDGYEPNENEFTDSYGQTLALKWGAISNRSAMYEFDMDFEMPYDEETGDVWDSCTSITSFDASRDVKYEIENFYEFVKQYNASLGYDFDESFYKRRPSKRRSVREGVEDTDVKDEFMYAFLLDRMTVFNVNFYTLGNNKHPYFSTSADRFTRNKNDYAEGGQAQERLLYGKAKQFYEKWDHLHLSDLTDEEYDEIVSDIEDLKKAYPYYVAYEFDGKATRTSIPFYDIYKKSMEVPRRRR